MVPAERWSAARGRSLRVGDCVFKPIDNAARYKWACDLLLKLSVDGIRIPEPRRAIDGSFVFRGWAASVYEPGDHVHGQWQEKLQVTRLFHAKLRELDHSPIPPGDDWWSRAHKVAWQCDPLPRALQPQTVDKIETLFEQYRPLARTDGIIHSDICGNILFHENLNPCIIDFSPAYGSVEYAEAIMVADATAWENAPVDIVEMLPSTEHYRQHLLRAISFRVIVAALYEPHNVDRFLKEYAAFEPIIDLVSNRDLH